MSYCVEPDDPRDHANAKWRIVKRENLRTDTTARPHYTVMVWGTSELAYAICAFMNREGL